MSFETFFDTLSQEDQRRIALNAIVRLIEMEEVSYREQEIDCDGSIIKECLYWSSCGEEL
jgi:hypothetical protein